MFLGFMNNFFELELSLPDNYIFITKNNMQSLIEKRVGELDVWVIDAIKEYINSGSMSMVCNPNLYDPKIKTCREYINLLATNDPKPDPNMSNEEYLLALKKSEQMANMSAYQIPFEPIKFEFSKIPSFGQRSIYSECKGVVEDTYNCQYSFFLDKYYYNLTLHCFENEKDASIIIFNNFVNSLKEIND